MIDKSILDGIIVGRVDPHIYAFTTRTVPNYLKVGDTYRPVSERLQEWRKYFPQLQKEFEGKAKVSDNVYFRDFSVHEFLEREKHRERLLPTDISEDIYYSREFFKEATAQDIQEAIADILKDYNAHTQIYQFYNAQDRLPEKTRYASTGTWDMRPNQEKTVENFKIALDNGRKNLLMYAVMRFGKSFTSMCCAVAMNAKLVVVVSAKADVKTEWKKTVQSADNFAEYEFYTSDDLKANNKIITERLTEDKKSVLFLTLQDLQGDEIKDKHQEVFGQDIDLLLVDETHFGARAEKYGEVLKNANNYERDVTNKKDSDDFVDVEKADNTIKTLKANITIHLSGTPYRILMGSEFKKEDIIAFYQFTDIVDEQKKWDEENFALPEEEKKEDWENPYFGFPQMIRFAFRPNESSRKRLEELRKAGTTYAFSALFKPQSIKEADDDSHKKFIYEKEILDLLEVIDGSKSDDELLGFLDYDKLKEGKMCRHIVIVLPYCASCDALEELIKANKDKFRNLNGYEIVNISGVDRPNEYSKPEEIKAKIQNCEKDGKKTITLTVNRMLTGSTVPEWDTMLYLKDTASPQEYDQAVFRLQNQYVKTFKDETTGKTIKFNMKPQTLLVDFDPNRMFVMQEKKSKIYNANVDTGGNSELEKRIRKELQISPIITINKDKIERVVATDILEAVSNYQKDKGIKDEALEIPVDLSILDDSAIRAVIELENEIGSKSGLSVPAHDSENDDDGSNLDVPETPSGDDNDDATPTTDTTPISADDKRKQEISLTKKVQSYYTRILLFAFITKDTVISLSDIIAKMETEENGRIAKNLGLSKNILILLNQKTNRFVLSDLDYKIQDLNGLSRTTDLTPAERANVAVNKFGKLGDAIVITPSNICDDMVNLLPEEFIKSLPATNGKVLDIAGTAGEFAVALHKRMTELGLDKDFIANAIYTIPKSSICYELTRKLYEMLGLNIVNIASNFYSYSLPEITINGEIDYSKIKALLTQHKTFEKIKLTDTPTEGEENVNFEAIVGNPPYQEIISSNKSNKSLSRQLFPDFIKLTIKMNPKYVALITPSRWFTGDAQDGSFIKLRDFIKRNNHIKAIRNYPVAGNVFPDVFIAGGVNYYLYDKTYSGKVDFATYTNGRLVSQNRDLFEEGLDIVVSSSENYAILQKIRNEQFVSLTTITKGRDAFGITGKNANNVSSSTAFNDAYELRCAHEEIRYVSKDKITKNVELADKWKIFISKGNGGAGTLGDEKQVAILGKPYIGKAKSVCTDSLIPIGCFETEEEALNLQKYIKTKFLRYIVGILKVSQNVSQNVYQFVPLQDFTINSDIKWDKTIEEISEQLCNKYGFTVEEKELINNKIKPME